MKSLLRIPFLLAPSLIWATNITVDFEAPADGTQVNNAYTGVTFQNALVQTMGGSLSPLYPPASGQKVAINDPGGTMVITLDDPANYVQANFTYSELLTFVAYDAASVQLGTSVSKFNSNVLEFGDRGSSPNEIIAFSDPQTRIKTVRVSTASLQNDTFAIDNFTTVPEPSTALPLELAAVAAVWLKSRRRVGKWLKSA